mmetsp:Transcript_24944/g.38744  ORF Transcript_24944/g.38744 Transcript_24944/m.38744 type:complete len:112 (+) Transcript_24944:405-740(+)
MYAFEDHESNFKDDKKMDPGDSDGIVEYDGSSFVVDKTEDENEDSTLYIATMPKVGSIIMTKVKFLIIVAATKCNVNSISANDGGSTVEKVYHMQTPSTTLNLEGFFTYNF